ncbi:hypothetical protein BJ875DRAFT_476729 [Amylocarpus encephaloides]|uniref:Family A G protein-coupled receptor-like protein n=1 Tax=Amylocarpus encephaloides TaxID=45428 RepID=A0A9P7Y8J7_9HELO|nr:hypothetical protein BJ875DRAFT_476729 [Amylocarpus encephaloides]
MISSTPFSPIHFLYIIVLACSFLFVVIIHSPLPYCTETLLLNKSPYPKTSTMSLLPRNTALDVNPPVGQHHLSNAGSDWLWSICALYSLGLLLTISTTYFAKSGEKIFHYLFTISFFCGAVAYFGMASDLGNVAVKPSEGDDKTRQIFWAGYIGWFLCHPPLLLALGLISGVSWATIIYNVVLLLIWITTYLIASLTPTTYKWGFFTFGTMSLLLLSSSLLYTGTTTSRRLALPTSRTYGLLASYLSFVFLLYPIAFGLGDGGNEISVTSSFVFIGILDVLTVPVIAAWMLWEARGWDLGGLNLVFTQYGRVRVAEGKFPEKKVAAAATPEALVVGEGENVV